MFALAGFEWVVLVVLVVGIAYTAYRVFIKKKK